MRWNHGKTLAPATYGQRSYSHGCDVCRFCRSKNLRARIYEVLPLICPHCGAEMRLIAAITDQPSIARILTHIGEPGKPPPITPARGPPEWEWGFDQRTLTDDVEPIPDYEFDLGNRSGHCSTSHVHVVERIIW